MIVRAVWRPSATFEPGIRFAGKEVLELSVAILGISVDLPLLRSRRSRVRRRDRVDRRVGLGRRRAHRACARTRRRLAILVACGNAICGNSAIAAVAPVIGADAEDVASSIAFTAILGVIVVLGLPLLIGPLRLTNYQYGVLAG